MKNFHHPPSRHPALSIYFVSLCCFLCSALCIHTVQAQLAGVYTIGGSNGDYATFNEATQALEAEGISGPVTFKVRPGTYQEQVKLGSFPGNSCDRRVTFEGEVSSGSDVKLEYYSRTNDYFVFQINDADGITIRNLSINGSSLIFDIRGGSDCIILEHNIINGLVSINGGSDDVLIRNNEIGAIRASSGAGELSSNRHHYKDNIFFQGISKVKSGVFNPSSPDFDEGLEIIGNRLGSGIELSAQKGIIINENHIELVTQNDYKAAIDLTNSWYGKEIRRNIIDVKSYYGRAFGIRTANGIPERVSENRIRMEGAETIENPHGDDIPGLGGGTAILVSTGKTEAGEVLIANNDIYVDGYDRRGELGSLNGIHIKENYSGKELIKVYHNTVNTLGYKDLRSSNSFLSESAVADKSLYILNNVFSNNSYGNKINIGKPSSVAVSDYNSFGESLTGFYMKWGSQEVESLAAWQQLTGQDAHSFSSGELAGAGIKVEEVDIDINGKLRNDPPSIGAYEHELSEERKPLAGTYTIGGADGDFTTFSLAVAALNERGIASSVTFRIRPGTYSEQITIGKFPGNSCENPVVFESESAEKNAVFLTHPSAYFVIKIMGADGIRIRNLNISGSETLVDIQDGADCTSMENNILTGMTGETTNALVNAVSSSTNTGDYHRYQGNVFIGGGAGLRKSNVSTAPGETVVLDKGLVVMDNEFRDQKTAISLTAQEGYRVNRNKVNSDKMNASGIVSVNSFNGNEVSGNVIVLPVGSQGIYFYNGVPERVIGNRVIMTELGDLHYETTGIGLDAKGSDYQREMLVANNIIKMYNSSYYDLYMEGINISGTAKVYHNSVLLSGPKSSTALYGYGSLRVFNNNISNLGKGRVVSTNAVTMDYNNLYGGNFNLPDWQSSTGRDLHSISVRPGEDLLHPKFEGAGIYLKEVPTDIAGQPRNTPPSIGAIELGADPDQTKRVFTIGGENPDYPSFTEAIRDLTFLDGRDTIFFSVRPGIYKEQVRLDTSYLSYVVFEGESRDSTEVLLEYPEDYAVRIHNASRYAFRYMTISGKGAVSIEAEKNGTSEHITFESNILRSIGNTATVFTYTQPIEQYRRNSVSFLSFKNNYIIGDGWGIYKGGALGRHQNGGPVFISDKGLEIIGNQILTGGSGIKVGPTVGAVLNFNTLVIEKKPGSAGSEGISLNTINNLLEVIGNEVVVNGPEAKGIIYSHIYPFSSDVTKPRRFIDNKIILPDGGTGLRFDVDGNPHPVLVANNMISVKGNEGSVGVQMTEFSPSSKFYFNSILIYGNDSQSRVLSLSESSPDIKFANNILANTAGGFVVHGSNSWLPVTDFIASSDYNDFYTNGAKLGHWYGADVLNLSEWQILTGLDAHSISADPQFESTEMLIPANPALDGAGIAVAEVERDIFGQLRNSPPDIGAVEFEAIPEEPTLPAPTLGHVFGGGWFYSPAGAITQEPLVEGKAILSLNAQQKKKDKQPKGNAHLIIPQTNFHFQSRDAWEWMSVDENMAILKGTGTLNRQEGYSFVVSVVDKGNGPREPQDTYRIIIWDSQGAVVYDNQRGTPIYGEAAMPIGGGNIRVREDKSLHAQGRMQSAEQPIGAIREFKAYPTRLSKEGLWIEIPALEGVEQVYLRIIDQQGREIAAGSVKLHGEAVKHFWELHMESSSPGVYLLLVQSDRQLYQQKLVK